VELCEVDVQMLDRFVGERHDAGLVTLPGEGDMPGLGEGDVPQGETGDLADAGGGVVEEDE
jgi:hypothetical protein